MSEVLNIINENFCDRFDDIRKYCECLHRHGLYDPVCIEKRIAPYDEW